jgi:RIO kinase 1
MNFSLNKLDPEDYDQEDFAKIRNKTHRLKARQSVRQLVARVEDPADPDARFESADLNELCRQGYLEELVASIKTGKEASVYLGRNLEGYVAVKIYTDLRVRSFKRDELYREGRYIGDVRVGRAIEQGSKFGLDAHQVLWVQEEFRQMQHLEQHGVRVPKAIAVSGISLVMEFIGDEHGEPAPRISDLKLGVAGAQEAFRQSVEQLRRIVAAGRVHGDYSTFNILWHEEQAVVIDFPQVIVFQQNRNAMAFLERDVQSLCKSFRKQGILPDEAQTLKEVRGAWK